MKAITTTYKGATNTRGSRIIASDEDGNRVSISYPYEYSGSACHAQAAIALCTKMNWEGDLIAGAVKGGYVFVFANSDRFANPTRDKRRAATEVFEAAEGK